MPIGTPYANCNWQQALVLITAAVAASLAIVRSSIWDGECISAMAEASLLEQIAYFFKLHKYAIDDKSWNCYSGASNATTAVSETEYCQ